MSESDLHQALRYEAYTPAEIAARVESAGVGKAALGLVPTLMLGVLAGAFISFGALLFTFVVTDSGLGFGPQRLLGGVAFSLGLVLVVVGGAELFTGNNLIVMAWAARKITIGRLLRNWGLVYVGNLVGAVATAFAVHLSGVMALGDGAPAGTAVAIGMAKVGLPFLEACFRGILCNVLVCLAVWLCFAARTVTGKVLVIVFPISAFVAVGFEHSVANMYLLPMAMLSGASEIGIADVVQNLVPVTIGNVLGGGGLVALVYWAIYLRGEKDGRV
jgi:formate transporter